jgi:hypothetical protein
MSENALTGVQTRHVDKRNDFVRQFIEDGVIEFVRLAEYHSDLFKKNF